jgi:hypothetical protein
MLSDKERYWLRTNARLRMRQSEKFWSPQMRRHFRMREVMQHSTKLPTFKINGERG